MRIQRAFMTVSATALVLGGLGLAGVNLTDTARANSLFQADSSETEGYRGRRRGPDFAAAAAELGVSEDQLKAALEIPAERPQPDFAAAAAQLGTTEAELRTALQEARSEGQRGRPDLASVAEQFGVSVPELRTALGLPTQRPRPDLSNAAQELGVSETELRAALRNSRGCRDNQPSPDA